MQKLYTSFFKKNNFFYWLSTITIRKKENLQKTIYYKKLLNLSALTEKEIYHEQNVKLKEFLTYVQMNIPYYKKKLEGVALSDFKFLPLMTKDIICNNFDSLLTSDINFIPNVRRNTGGSTGAPFEFLSDLTSGYIDLAHHEYLYSLMGYKKNDVIVGCGGVALDKKTRNKGIYWVNNHQSSLWGALVLSALYLNESTICLYINKLNDVKPDILRGYPSFYHELARYIIENKVSISFKLKGINLTSEKCTIEQRKLIEKAFGAKVYFEYGHTEISVFAYTSDSSYEYQTSPYYGYVEVLNEKGEEVNIGEIGELVVTGFINKGMPFIRYRTGDNVKLTYRNGGHVKFSEIEGRAQDYIVDRKNQRIYLTALIFGQHFSAFSKIQRWQIVQKNKGEITFIIKKNKNYMPNDELEIIDKILKVANLKINFDYINDLKKTPVGKTPFLIKENK